jgi:hypothetical protein
VNREKASFRPLSFEGLLGPFIAEDLKPPALPLELNAPQVKLDRVNDRPLFVSLKLCAFSANANWNVPPTSNGRLKTEQESQRTAAAGELDEDLKI